MENGPSQLHQRLLAITPTASPDLRAAWQAAADALLETPHTEPPAGFQNNRERFFILVTCRDEKQQVELLGRFKKDGLECKALLA